MKRLLTIAAALGVAMSVGTAADAADRTVKIAGFGAMSGVVRSFGINTQAVMQAAAKAINEAGGVKLADGSMAPMEVTFDDDRCNAEEGISVVRRLASGDAVVGVGPTCSNVAEPLFGILQAKAGDEGDSGLQFPIFTDTAIKGGLAKISEWAFRNVPNESQMYKSLFEWLATQHPDAKSVYGGVEEDFAHSRFTWYKVMKTRSADAGYEVKGESKWLLNDTNFTTQVREMKRAGADIIAISAHPFTTCGVLKEMARQRVKYKVLVGLTSSSSLETLNGCAKQAEGIIIPTSFAPVNPDAVAAADAAAALGGSADLHSAAAWEIMMILKDVIEQVGIQATADSVQADRQAIRDGLANLKTTKGLLGEIQRTDEGEAVKPYVYVHADDGTWAVLHDPGV
ncbi:MAG: ABC transporter substrate-binding protein [Alphaproteobacteria bacterium]|nr:ABC transporter substrate-binding protein [Alphaproteobacteria bacterium]